MPATQYGKQFDYDKFMTIMEDIYQELENVPLITLMALQSASPFKLLISTIMSARTKDETTIRASKKLYRVGGTPQKLAKLTEQQIADLIYPIGFYRTKAKNLKKTAQALLDDFNGEVPQTMEELLTLPGVGRKTANLVLGEAFKKPAICVDTHVHRIANQLGILKTKNPTETEMVLREILPKKYWISFNTFLVAYGQVHCRPISPHCSTCKVKSYCKQVGVKSQR